MKIYVRVKPNSKVEKVEQIDSTHYKICIKEPAKEGKANSGVRRVMAAYFNVAPSTIILVSGTASRDKVLEVV